MGGIIPNKEDAITPGLLFTVSLPGGTSYDLADPTTFGGLTERLDWRNQLNVVEFLKAQVKQFPEWLDAANSVFDGLRRGVPGGENVPLPLAIIEALASQITGLPPGTWATVNEVVADLNSLPGVAQVIALLTNLPSVALTDAITVLGSYGSNLNAFLGATDFTSPTWNITDAATAFVNLVLSPLHLIPTLIGGLIPALNIPPLDATKIVSGTFASAQLQPMIDAVSQGFSGGTGLSFGGLQSLLGGLPTPQALTDAIGAGLGHLAGGYTPANITSFLGAIPGANIASTLLASVIPGLDLSKITSGLGAGIATWLGAGGALPSATTLATTGLTGLAANIGTWLTGGGALPVATTLQGSQLLGSVASSLLSGVLGTGLIPGLDLSKITSGLATGMSTWLGAAGAIPAAATLQGSQLIGSVASSLLSGVLSTGLIPGLDLSKITSGLGTGIATWLGVGGALPGATTLGATGLTGLATNVGPWLTGGGALPSATTLQGSQLLGSVASSLLSGTISTGIIPGIDLSKITSGLGAGIATWLGAGGNLPSATTVAGQLVTDIQATAAANTTTLANATTAALSAGAADLNAAITQGQKMADQTISAMTGGLLSPGQTPAQFANTFNSIFAQWTNAIKSTSLSTATAPDMTSALQQQATQQAAQAAITASIQAQLPKFYGASGTAGLSANVSFTGLTTLPAGWTDIACALCAKVAKYNTICTGDSQTVSGIWSGAEYLPKYLILRANAAFTTLVYAKIQSNNPSTGASNCEIGCLNSGTKTVFDTFALPGDGTQQANQAYTFSATAYTFQLLGPNGLSRNVIDGTTTHVSQLGALYRYGGFGNNGVIDATVTRTTAGNFAIPAGFTTGDKFDVGLFGGYGGGGGGGSGANFGGAGGWGGIGGWGNSAAFTWVYGTDFPLTTTTFAFTPGAGGAGGAGGGVGGPGGGGASGGTSSLAVTGLSGSPKTASGGTGGAGGQPGIVGGGNGANGANGSPGSAQYAAIDNGIWATTPANAYGGPGSPGQAAPFTAQSFPGGNGGAGADGSATVALINMHRIPGTMLNWVFYDSGPSAGPATSFVATGETTTSTSYVDLATTTDQVTVNIGATGLALVFIDVGLAFNTNANGKAKVSFAVSGATTIAAPARSYEAIQQSNAATQLSAVPLCGAYIVANLNPGATTFKMKYSADTNGGTASFYVRSIAVTPL